MTSDKPSRNEEEYFARLESERIEARRTAAGAAAERAERLSHYMKCPKCGTDLVVEEYEGIQIDRCSECNGIWFDDGEAELLVAKNQAKGVGGIFRAIAQGVRGRSKKSRSE